MKVCVDPGHGMSNRQPGVYDPGATHIENGYRYEEAAIVLRYGLAVKDVLRAKNIEVFMTRDDNEDHAPVGRRASMAQDAGCDLYISLHLNDVDDDSANGLEVLYNGNDDKKLAKGLLDGLVKVTKIRDRGIKPRPDLAVLKFSGPAVLIEIGFIANDADRAKILSPQVRDSVALTIGSVLAEYGSFA